MRLTLVFWMAGAFASAEVVDKSANGFLVRGKIEVGVKPADAYRAIVDIGQWWQSDHTWSGNAKNMSITPKAGGCFCEQLPPDGSVQHMAVVFAAPGKMLRMTGGIGPLQGSAVAGTMTFELKPTAAGTEISMEYSVGGYMPGGLAAMAEPVNGVLAAQLAGLKKLLDQTK